MDKVIFLDIDGVLNMYGVSSRTFMKPYGQHIEPHLVCRLNYICEQVKDLKIVISSSWRMQMEDLQKQLEEQGFKYWDRVIGKTPFIEWRGNEIQSWIDTNNFKGKYLVIDDEVNDICGNYCDVIHHKNVLQTNSNEGMLNSDALFVVRFFND